MDAEQIRALAGQIMDDFFDKLAAKEEGMKRKQLDAAKEGVELVKSLYDMMNQIEKKAESL